MTTIRQKKKKNNRTHRKKGGKTITDNELDDFRTSDYESGINDYADSLKYAKQAKSTQKYILPASIGLVVAILGLGFVNKNAVIKGLMGN